MRKVIMLAAVVSTAAIAPPVEAATHQTTCEKAYNVRHVVIKKHGKRVPGRNICRFGVQSKFNKKWSKPATNAQKAAYLRNLKALVAPPQFMTAVGAPSKPPAGTLSPRANLPYCTWGPESGGDYRAVSPDGKYGGKYQMDMQTWQSVGGSGSPAAASPAEQDKRAAMLYASRGGQPWANC
jgi:hypothetical protein